MDSTFLEIQPNNTQLNCLSLAPGLPHFQISSILILTSFTWCIFIDNLPHSHSSLSPKLLLHLCHPPLPRTAWTQPSFPVGDCTSMTKSSALQPSTSKYRTHTEHASFSQKGLLSWERDAQWWEQTISQLKGLWHQNEELECFCWVCRQPQRPGLLIQSLKIQWRWPQPSGTEGMA